MMDKLTEAIIRATDEAVEEQTIMFGPHYASALEGYGDTARELLNIQDGTKALKKSIAGIVDWVSAQDMAELNKALILVEGKANMLAYEALKMCAVVKRFRRTVTDRSGGDLLDLLEDDEE